jgi:CRP-like cAMP-binding protein
MTMIDDANTTGLPAHPAVRHPLTILPNPLKVLSAKAQRKIRANSYIQTLQKGQCIVQTGEFFDDVIVVQSGWLALDIDNVCVSLLPPNTFYFLYLGEIARPAVCNLRAVSSNTSIAVMNKDALWEAFEEAPKILRNLCDGVIQQMAKSFSNTAKRITEPLEVRLAHFLWGIGIPQADGTRRIPSVIPQSYIASYLGASREEISRKKQMLVRTNYLYKKDNDWYLERVPAATA